MVKQISLEKQNNIKAALLQGGSTRSIANDTGVSKITVDNYRKKFNITCTSKGGRPKRLAIVRVIV